MENVHKLKKDVEHIQDNIKPRMVAYSYPSFMLKYSGKGEYKKKPILLLNSSVSDQQGAGCKSKC